MKQPSASEGLKVFFDIEASSLHANSFPIEVGWAVVGADLTITSDAILIVPQPDWTDWHPQAEKVHGIRRCWLDQYGLPALDVAKVMNRVFGTGVVFSDAPEWEAMWTRRLYDAVGVRRTWRIGDALPLLRATAGSQGDNGWLTTHLEDTRLHRADADALVLAEGYVEMRRRRELAALLDKANQTSPAAQGASHTVDPTKKGANNE